MKNDPDRKASGSAKPPSGGYIRVFRQELVGEHPNHPFSTGEKACREFAVIDLRGLACWEDKHPLERGEVEASVSFLCKRWNWSPGKVRRFLEDGVTKGIIKRYSKKGVRSKVISICNYEFYSGTLPRFGQSDGSDGETQVENRKQKNTKHEHSVNDESLTEFDGFESSSSAPDQRIPLISSATFAGVVRRFNGGVGTEAGIANEQFFRSSLGLDPLSGCYALIGIADQVDLGELCGEISLEFCDPLEPLVELGRDLVGEPTTSSELHDELDALFPDTAPYRPANAG